MLFDPQKMGDSAHGFVKVVLGIDLPRASAPAMRAASEVYDNLDRQLKELSDVMDVTRGRIRRNFGGAASDYYDRSLAAFTRGEKDYLGNAASTSRMLSTELRKAAANVDYMVAMVWVQVAQLIAEITWAIATAKFTFGASLKWIPIFKAIRSLAIRRLIAWFLFTVPSHQIVSQVFASFGALIQRVQIANGDRDGFDQTLLRDAHVGAVIEGLVSAGISGGIGAFINNGFATTFTRNIDDLRGMPDPVPPPPVREGAPDPVPTPPIREGAPEPVPPPVREGAPDPVPTPPVREGAPDPVPTPPTREGAPDPVPPPVREGAPDPAPTPPIREGAPEPVPAPGRLNDDLADLFTRHRDEMLVPFHPNSPTGARAWDNAVERNVFRTEVADVFQRAFAERLGSAQARRLGDDYADTLVRSWGDPDLGSQLSRTIGDRLPPPLREHLSDVPHNLGGALHQSMQGFLPYMRGLGLGAGTGAAEGFLGEGLGSAASGQGFVVTPWSATSGATMNTTHQLTTDSALAGMDALSGPGGTILPPDLPPPPEPERPVRGEEDPARGESPATGPAPAGNDGGGRPTPARGPVIPEITLVPPAGEGDGDGSAADGADAHRPGGSPGPDTADRDAPATRRPDDRAPEGNPPERTADTPDTRAPRDRTPEEADRTDAHRTGDRDTPAARGPQDRAPEGDDAADAHRTGDTPDPNAQDRDAPAVRGPRDRDPDTADGTRPAAPVPSREQGADDPPASPAAVAPPAPAGADRTAPPQGTAPPGRPSGEAGQQSRPGTQEAPGSRPEPSPAGETGPERNGSPAAVESSAPADRRETPAPRTESTEDTAASDAPAPAGTGRPGTDAPPAPPAAAPPAADRSGSTPPYSFDASLNPVDRAPDTRDDTDDFDDASSVGDTDSDTSSLFDDAASDTSSLDTAWSDTEDAPPAGADARHPAAKDPKVPEGLPDAPGAVPAPDILAFPVTEGGPAGRTPTASAPADGPALSARPSPPADQRPPAAGSTAPQAPPSGTADPSADRPAARDTGDADTAQGPGTERDAARDRGGDAAPAVRSETGGEPATGEAARTADPADARAARAADLVAEARRHLGEGDLARARAVSADIQGLLSPRSGDGDGQNPSVRRARTLALGLVFTLSDPADRRAPADGGTFPADRAEDAATLLAGIERNLRDRNDPVRARLWLPGGLLTTQYVRDALSAAPAAGVTESGRTPAPRTADAPPAAATAPGTTGGAPVPTQSAGPDAPGVRTPAGPDGPVKSGPDTPGEARTVPAAPGTDPRADARAASVLNRLPELTSALEAGDAPRARALGAEFWRLLGPVGGPAAENRSVREARTLAQALVYVTSDPYDRKRPVDAGALPPERVQDAQTLARGIGRHLRDRNDPVRARLWLPGGRLTTDYVRYAMQDPADRGPSPYGAPAPATTVNMARVDGGEGTTDTAGTSDGSSAPARTEDTRARTEDGGTEDGGTESPAPLSPSEAGSVAERAHRTAENALNLARGAAERVSAAARTATDTATGTAEAVTAAEQAARAREDTARAAGAARDAARLAAEAARGTAAALDRAGQAVREAAADTDAHRAASDDEAAVRARHEETVRLREEAQRHARDADTALRDAETTADDALTTVSRRVAAEAGRTAGAAERAAAGAANALRVTREAADRAAQAARDAAGAADTATAVTAAEQGIREREAAATGAGAARVAADQAAGFARRTAASVELAGRITRAATPGTDAHRTASDDEAAVRSGRDGADRRQAQARALVAEAATARHDSTAAAVDALTAAADRAAFDSAGTRIAADEAYRRSGIAENRRARVEEAVRAAEQADAARPRRAQDVRDAADRVTDAVRRTRETADGAGRARAAAESAAGPERVAATAAALDALGRAATALRASPDADHPAATRIGVDLRRTDALVDGARDLLGRTAQDLADARRHAQSAEDSAARAEALLPRDLPSASRLREKTDARYDLDYLVTSRLSGPDRLFTRAVHQAVADIVGARITDPPPGLPRLVDAALNKVAHEHGMSAFFVPGGREITVTDPGTDGADPRSWTVRVSLASDDPAGYRHLDVGHRESGAPLESREEERSRSTTTGGSSSYDPRRILAARFTGSPLLLGDVTGSAAGPWVTVGGSFSRGQRAASQGGTTEAASKIEYSTFAAPEFYANDLRVWAEVTARPEAGGTDPGTDGDDAGSGTGEAAAPAVDLPVGSSVIRDGMVFTLAGEVQARPDTMPGHIDLSPGAGGENGPGRRPRGLGPLGGLPIAVHSVTPRTPAGSGPAHTDLGSWIADHLVSDAYRLNRQASSDNAAVQWMKDVTGPGTGQDIGRWKQEIRAVLDNDSLQEYLPHLDRGPVTVSVSHPRLGEVMMELSATPRDYRIKEHGPLIDDATFKESIKDGTSLSQSRNTSFTLTGGVGFGLVAELPSGGTLRVNAPHVEATWWQSLHSESHNTSGSGEHRSLSRYVSSTEEFAAYEASHELSVRIQGETEPHRFTVTGVELLPGETAAQLDRAARGEGPADTGSDGERRPPFPHLDSDRPVHFRGSHFLGLEWSRPAPGDGGDGAGAAGRDSDGAGEDGGPAAPVTSDDRRSVLERYLDDVLAGIAREHPGLVIPELARDRDTYARRPGREEASYFERSFRERWGFRRSYNVAYKNTMLVRDTLQSTLGKDDLERLARPGEGLPVRLRESATVDPTLMARLKEFFRPDTVTVRLHAEFGRLSHGGPSTAETGLRVRGAASASTESATGSAFTLAVSAGSGMVRSAEGDARGFARLVGGFMAAVGWNRVNHFDAAYGLGHKSDARLFFPEGSDRWNGEVTLSARLHGYDADEQAYGTDGGTDLLDRPLKATYSLVTATTVGDNLVSAGPAAGRADGEGSALTPEQAREMLDPRPGRRAPAEEEAPETGDDTGTTPAEGTRETPRTESGTPPAAVTDATGESAETAETGETAGTENGPVDGPPADNTRVLLDNGAIIEHVNPLLQEAGGTEGAGPVRNLLRRTFDTFSRPRRFWSDGGLRKLSSFLDGVGGATLLSNLMSPTAVASDPASFAESGRRRRIEVPGTWLSPNDMRATGVTKVTVGEITDLRLTKAQVTVQSETSSTASAAVTRIGGFFARFTGYAGGTTNTIEEGGADSGADRSSANGTVPMAGPSHSRSFLRRGETSDSGVSSASGILMLPKSAAVYAFTAAGTIAQAWEFKKHRGLNFPNWWSHRYSGWKARVSDLVSGYITARDAEQTGIVTDAVTHGDDGAPRPATQTNPAPPPHARVRAGFDSAGRQALPVDPAHAVDTLETRLRTHGLTLSRGGKERLLVTLSEQLGTATDALPPVPVNVVSTDRNAHFSKPARVLVDLARTDPRVDYVTSAAATIESHSWQAEHAHEDSRHKSSTTSANFIPWQPSGMNGGDGRPADSSLMLTSPAGGAAANRNGSQSRSSASETTHTIVMESSGPYVKVSQDATLTLTIEVDGDGLVPTAGIREGGKTPYLEHKQPVVETVTVDGGRIRTFHLGSSLDLTPPAAPAAPLDTVPAPPPVTPRAGDTLAGAVTTATGELAPPPAALRDAVIMPTAVHGPDVRDTALRTIATSLGWKAPAAPDFGPAPTAEQLDRIRAHHTRAADDARRHIADHLELDPRYTPIDNSLNPVALKGLLSHNLGRPSGTDILRIGRTQWRVAATPDFTGSRIVTARPDARLVHKEAEGQSISHGRSRGGGTTTTAAFRPTGHHTVDADNGDRTAMLTGSGEAAARTGSGDSPTGDGLATGEPSEVERQRLGTAYLVEFDTTWTVGARTEEKAFFGGTTPRQFTSHHTGKASAWISRSDAIALGVLTAEQADAAETPVTAEYDAAKAMADAEAAYIEERAKLPALVKAYLDAHQAHAAGGTAADRAALDRARTAYETQDTAYRTALASYERSITAWTAAVNATTAHLAGITPPDAPPPWERPGANAPLDDQLRPVFDTGPREAPADGTTTDPAPPARTSGSGTAPELTVLPVTDIAGQVRDPEGDGTDLDGLARGLGLTDTDAPSADTGARGTGEIRRLRTGAEADRYGALLHDPAHNPNTFDALPAATRDTVSSHTRDPWLSGFARLRPLDEATVQAELDRIRRESGAHPGWLVYEAGGGRWPDLARLEQAAERGDLGPEQERVVRGVLDAADPPAVLADLAERSGRAGRIAESLALRGEPARFPDASEVLAMVRRLDRATGQPLPGGFEAVHGMYEHRHLLDGSTDPLSLVGTTHVEHGYLSVSLGTSPAAAGGAPVDLMRLAVPEGSRGLWVGDRSEHPNEREAILARETRYRITAVEPRGHGYLFHAEVLPPAHGSGEGAAASPSGLGGVLDRIDGALSEQDAAAALEQVRGAAERFSAEAAEAAAERSADGPGRTAALDRLEGLRDAAERLADRAAAMAGTVTEAVGVAIGTAADIAAAAGAVAARGAAGAVAARDALPGRSEPTPEDPDAITAAARERDAAAERVAEAGTARESAERAARIAYEAAETAVRTARTDGDRARAEEVRAAARAADADRSAAVAAARGAAERYDSLVEDVNVAAGVAVGLAIGDMVAARGDAAAEASALARARAIAELTSPGSGARMRLAMRLKMPGIGAPTGSEASAARTPGPGNADDPAVFAVTDTGGRVREPDAEDAVMSGADLDHLARGLGLADAPASLADVFRTALNTPPPAPEPQGGTPVSVERPAPNADDETTVFLMEQADPDPDPGEAAGRLPEPAWTRAQEAGMADLLGLEDPADRAAPLRDPAANPHTFTALPADQREAVAAQAATGWLSSLTWTPSLDVPSLQSRLEDLTYDAGDNVTADDLNGWPLYERNGNRWPTLTEVRESYSERKNTHAFNWLADDVFQAPDPAERLRHWYDNADEAGALAKANGGVYPTAHEVLRTLHTLDAATDRPLPGPVEVAFAPGEGLHGLTGYVEGDPSSLVGTEQREAGYLATSLDRSAATAGDGDATALVRLTVPEGGRGLWVGDGAGTSDPYTLLLPRGTGYRVTGVTESDGTVEITAVALPPLARPLADAPAEPVQARGDGERPDDGDDGTGDDGTGDDTASEASEASEASDPDTDGDAGTGTGSRGTLGEDGIRRFGSPGEVDRQDRWLNDPAENPHAFDTLTPEQQRMVDTYTRSAWITRVARIRPFLPQTVARQLMEWRSQSRAEAADPDTAQIAHGWDLYEANGLAWPSVERLRLIAASPQPPPPRTLGLIRNILGAPDPRAELRHWYHNAGYAGVIARLNGGTYPDAAATRELFRLLDGAVDHPLPEGMAVSRGMQTIDHLLRTTGGTDPRALVGTVHTEPGYMSTTLGDSPFKTDVDGFPFLLRLDVPEGTRGLWIGTRSHDPEQMELTLGRGTTYRITGVQDRIDPESGGPQTVVTATVAALPRAVPDLFSEGSTGEDGVRRFWNAEQAHWYGHRLHDPAHNPYAVNALPRAQQDLARALSALAGRYDLTRTDPDGTRELLDSLRAASRVTPASTPEQRQRILGWELYEANGFSWPSPQRLLQLLPVEQGRNPARARFITDILRHGPQEAARRLERLYATAGDAGTLARANGGGFPAPARLRDMLAFYDRLVHRPLPETVETTWYLDPAAARAQLNGYDPDDPAALAGTEQATRGHTAVALNPRPAGRGDGAGAVVRLVLPAGAHGLWLGNAGTHPQNQEIVLPPGTAFRIDSVDTSGGRPVVTARVHAPAADTAPPVVPPAAGAAPAPVPAPADAPDTTTAEGADDGAAGPDAPRTGDGPGDGRGYVDGNGIRRFRTAAELDAYDRWLHDPANNPHAFSALDQTHRDRITGYTIDGWLNTVARDSMGPEQIGTVLDQMRQDTVTGFTANPMGTRGWELYEMNDLAWPTLDRLRDLLDQGRVPERAEGFVRYILDAPDPREELLHWYVNAGEAGEIARSSGDVFPTPERTLEHLRTLTEAIDRPLPEGIEVTRGLEELDHIAGFDGKDPYSLVGTVHTERGFMSTSLGGEPAGVTARYAHALHLVLPPGSRGMWIGSRSRYPEERELILPPGTTYRITRAGWGGSRGLEGLYIEAEVIVAPAPEAAQAPTGAEGSADLHVFAAQTDTDATVTGPDAPDAEAEAGLAALLGLGDSGREETGDDSGREDTGDDVYDDRPLLDRWDSDDDGPPPNRWDSDSESDDDADTAPPPSPAYGPPRDGADGPGAADPAAGHGPDGADTRTPDGPDTDAERMADPVVNPHTYDALPPDLRALVTAHAGTRWLNDLARLGTTDPATVQSTLDEWRRSSLWRADDPDDPNGWALYEANGLSWPSLGRVRELYAAGAATPGFLAIATDVFRSSDPVLRLEHWYGEADEAGALARADGGVYPTAERALELLRDMDTAVDRPLPGPVEVSFALDVDRDLTELDGYDWDDLSALVGRDQREPGYLPVTLGASPYTTDPRDTLAVVRMVLPEGARGLWVGDGGGTGDRHALVLPRDSGYRVTDVRITGEGMEISAEWLPARSVPAEPPAEEFGDGGSDASTVVDEQSRLPEGDGRGHVGDDGYRRFRSLEELDAYDRWLQDPAHNPHAFDTLTADQRRMVDVYTRSAWITRLARVRPLSPAGVASQLALVQNASRNEAGQAETVATAHGWDLYEANGLTWPTLDRLRELQASPDQLPPRTAGLIGHILTARDPAAELLHWFHNAGYAGVIARHNGGTYPGVDRVLELFGLLDDATGRPLPEGVAVSRGMHTIDHLLRPVGARDADGLVGTVHTEPGYMSTTLGDRAFKTDADPFRYLLRLDVPQGAHGLWIGSRSHDPEQRELTLARGTAYRITEARETFDPGTGDTVTVLSAEVVLRPESFADPLSHGYVDDRGVRRFRTSGEADWYAHRAVHAQDGLRGPDTLPARARRVAEAFSDTPWLADLALVSPDDVPAQLDRLRSMSRTERPSIVDPHGSSGWEVYEANGLTWPTPERLREIVDAAEPTHRTLFLRGVLSMGSVGERLDGLYRRSGPAGALAAANGGTYPSAEGVRELLETYDAALERPLPHAIEATWVLTHTLDLRFPEGYDERDPSALVGTVQSNPGYTTVSVNPAPVGLGHAVATVRLTLPAGAHGLWLGADGPRPSNHEIVLPRGTSYRVTGAENTSRGLELSAEVVVPERDAREPGARETAERTAPASAGTGPDTAAPGAAPEHTADPDPSGAGTPAADPPAADPPAADPPAGDGRGYVDDRGVRRFRTEEETDAYGRWLHDPANNPYAFDTLDERRRADVRGYTADGWLNAIVRDRLSTERIQESLDRVRESTVFQTDSDPMAARGWILYELNDLSWPTAERLGELLAQGRVPEHVEGFVRYILDADDPRAELAAWYANAGDAGIVARSNGGVFPTAPMVNALLERLDQTVDRPLPETVEAVRGLQDAAFLDGFRDMDPYALVGTVQREPGFMSVSLGGRQADHLAAESDHVLHLTVPAGSRGLWIGERSEYPEEREIALARGTAYRITRAGWGGPAGVRGFHIEAEVIVPPAPEADVPEAAPPAQPQPQQPAGDSSDVQVFTVQTDTETVVTGPDDPGLNPGAEAFMTALLGLDTAAGADAAAVPPATAAQDPAGPGAGTPDAGPDLPADRPGRVDPDGVRRFDTDGDGAGYGRLVLGDRFPSLAPEQQNSAQAYTKNAQFYNDFSRHSAPEGEVLRLSEHRFFGGWVEKWFDGHTPTRENAGETWRLLREGMEMLDRAMVPVPETVEVRRSVFGVGYMAPPGKPFRDPTDLIGTEFVERGFLSASLGVETVNRTAAYQFHLAVPAGHPALWIGDGSVHRSERELLLPRGTRFRVDDTLQDPDTGQWVLRVTVLPFAPAP